PVRHSEQNIEEVKRQLNTLNHAWERQAPPEAAEDIGFDANKGKWVLNWQAKYCPVHQRCTGDPDWMAKAEKRVRQLNKTI
ncbi:MAG: hypothetical protein Q8P59_14170, partial [Dehalococcoidia bacterium]|nr:hypothetical protein [Dehalococcoidia bacterium]